jgi:Flp pilus assembly protein TadD
MTARPRRAARWLTGLLGVLALLAASVVNADQRDPRLEELFRQLAEADGLQAQAIEGDIWRVWLSTGNDEVAELLDQGVRAMSHGDLDEAIALFDRIVDLDPDFAEGWNKRATARYLQRDFVGSMLDIRRTLALEPRHFGAISGMGLILIATGDPRGARDAFEAVLRVYPASPAAHAHLERLRRELGDTGA